MSRRAVGAGRLDSGFTLAGRRVEPALNRIVDGDGPRRLEPRTMAVLVCLAEADGGAVGADTLLARVWSDVPATVELVERAVGELRRCFGPEGARLIETTDERGYRLGAPVEAPLGVEPPPGSRALMLLVPLLVAVLAVVGGVLLARSILGDAVATRRPLRFVAISGEADGRDPAVSPDGARVAWARAASDGGSEIAMRLVGGGPPVALTAGPGEDRHPVWSPDGARLVFVRRGPEGCDLVSVPATGGVERRLAPCPDADHPALAWSPDGRWLAHTRADAEGRRGLALLDLESGEVRPLTTPPAAHLADEWPAFSPDGRLLAFVRSTTAGVSDVYRLDLEGGAPVRLTRDDADVVGLAWIGRGRALVFASNRAGLAGLFTVSASGGTPGPLAAGGVSRLERPSASRDGGLVAYEEWEDEIRLWRVPLAAGGDAEVVAAGPEERNVEPAVSADGERVAWASTRGGRWEIWAAVADGSQPQRLSDLGGPLVGQPRWSPEGDRVVAVARAGGQADLFVAGIGDRDWRRLTRHPADDVLPAWSRDGRSLLFASRRSGSWELWRVDAAGGDPVAVLGDGAWAAAESPDGSWLYYTRVGRRGLWRRPLAGGAEQPVLSELLPDRARDWVLNEAGLFYAADIDGREWLLRAEPDGSEPRPLVALGDRSGPGLDVSPDGRWLYLSRTFRRSSRVVAMTREP